MGIGTKLTMANRIMDKSEQNRYKIIESRIGQSNKRQNHNTIEMERRIEYDEQGIEDQLNKNENQVKMKT